MLGAVHTTGLLLRQTTDTFPNPHLYINRDILG